MVGMRKDMDLERIGEHKYSIKIFWIISFFKKIDQAPHTHRSIRELSVLEFIFFLQILILRSCGFKYETLWVIWWNVKTTA